MTNFIPFLIFVSANFESVLLLEKPYFELDKIFQNDLKRDYKIEDLLPHQLKHFEIFEPQQYGDFNHKRRKRDLSTEVQSEKGLHAKHTYFTINFEGKIYTLDVSLNQPLFPEAFNVRSYLPTGELHVHKPTVHEQNHCYYQGYVRGVADSQVIMSTCTGLKGSVFLPNDTLIFQPLPDAYNLNLEDVQYVVYRSSDVIKSKRNATCGHHGSPQSIRSFLDNINLHADNINGAPIRMKRDVSKERKFVELLLVVDNALAKLIGNPSEIREYVQELANYIDGFYQKLGIRIVLSSVEIWSNRDLTEISSDASQALDQFLKHRQERMRTESSSSPWVYADNVHLLYGKSFDGSTIGMASVGTMCGLRSGGVNEYHQGDVIGTAATVAHEMGHNFGLSHDSDDCACPSGADCIMEATSGFSNVREWSDCSKGYMRQSVRLGLQNCLVNVPPPNRIYGGSECGNDIVEAGEECDCGKPMFCESACCNATSCKLLSHAECDHGLCCSSCKFVASGNQCRGINGNECDLPEYCSGFSPNCPSNVFVENGFPCLDNKAACSEGVCLSYDMQCQTIWGPTARSGADICYETVNVLGTGNGNCGVNKETRNFTKCSAQNVKCGKLLCSDGNTRPVIGASRLAYINKVTLDNIEYRCKTITSVLASSDELDPGLVRSGTLCAPGKICQTGACVDTGNLTCSSGCNGNGRCNNYGNCHCDYGYAPPDCRLSGNGGSVDSGPSSNPVDTALVLMLVMFLVVLPIVLAAIAFVWFRFCKGREQIKTWKKNREDRLKAIHKSSTTHHNTSATSRSDYSSSIVPAVGFSQINTTAPSYPTPARPAPPPSIPRPPTAPNRPPPPRPTTAPPKPSFTAPTTSVRNPPVPFKPSSPAVKPLITPARSAPAAPNKTRVARLPPNPPAKPSAATMPYYSAVLTTDSESDEPSSLTVMERAKRFNNAV